MKHNPLIIALDTSSASQALNYVRRLKVAGVGFKIGYELFCAEGPRFVDKVLSHDVRVFLDLKFHDIPQTVARVSYVATSMGVWMFNVHASGGTEMMKRAKEASLEAAYKNRISPPLVLGVTVLTSMNDLKEINISSPVDQQVEKLAKLSQKAGLDGVVASAQEASVLRKHCGASFCLVTPGIRLADSKTPVSHDDQKRILTPGEAIRKGSHYLVVGRPVLQSAKPLQTIEKIIEDIEG